ncbi:alpha/beta hydrolase [Staphylococcus ureilyticus]|uniref:alpha/beta hydrolase n=1 Tax=Staphylococcus TaxID=1279 RepID=UPI0008A3AF46|nr:MULTISPECIES: alpha/beta hydrolase-fold protein [Staphylococcus]PIS61767.1 esterase [Corynebacterium striatum]MDK7753509.1 alpha/beta hydrolase-fold protein [Staphylococcus sp. UMB10092B]OFQ96046.1 esterase [Staphylococcus sp. HMSC065A08]OHO39817.1 esterase [Staphylococcus sp. HMSC034G07]OLF32948.1 esterase [Staphylococcus sp. 47.1]
MNIGTFKIHFQQHDIFVKLPKAYDEAKESGYSLILVQDGDELFKDIERDMILVGVQSNNRNQDYSPWETVVDGVHYKGEADAYILWMTKHLLPYLRKCFNISQRNEDICIAGASLGGLLALYTLFKSPENFGSYILISPSVWYPGFVQFMKQQTVIKDDKQIYWYVGALEGQQQFSMKQEMFVRTEFAVDILSELLFSDKAMFYYTTNRNGKHNVLYFKSYFAKAIKKLF